MLFFAVRWCGYAGVKLVNCWFSCEVVLRRDCFIVGLMLVWCLVPIDAVCIPSASNVSSSE